MRPAHTNSQQKSAINIPRPQTHSDHRPLALADPRPHPHSCSRQCPLAPPTPSAQPLPPLTPTQPPPPFYCGARAPPSVRRALRLRRGVPSSDRQSELRRGVRVRTLAAAGIISPGCERDHRTLHPPARSPPPPATVWEHWASAFPRAAVAPVLRWTWRPALVRSERPSRGAGRWPFKAAGGARCRGY